MIRKRKKKKRKKKKISQKMVIKMKTEMFIIVMVVGLLKSNMIIGRNLQLLEQVKDLSFLAV